MKMRHLLRHHAVALGLAIVAAVATAQEIEPPSKGQTVYVPVYSEVRHGNLKPGGKPESELMSVLVSVRNTDTREPIRVTNAPYYDTNGKLIRNYLSAPQLIPPMGTLELFVEHRENQGGSGANFLIRWEAEKPVSPPLAEALHTRFQAGKTLGFISRGKAVSSP